MNNIPILYYHSVANHKKSSNWSFLSCPIKVFKSQINLLARKGYYFCDWNELFAHINGEKILGKKTVMIQFDDGFLDNWTTVYPFMKKKNLKFSVLLTSDFIEESNSPREFVNETLNEDKSKWWGYLNKSEIKIMSNSGIVDFQSHAKTHTWYPSSDKLTDISVENNLYPHIIWNTKTKQKPLWLNEENFYIEGYPIFEHKKSLELDRAFNVKEEVIQHLKSLYNSKKSHKENMEFYKKEIEYIKNKAEIGSYETIEEGNKRIKNELLESKNKIQAITANPCKYLIFPGGGNNLETINIAKSLGYRLVSKGIKPNSFNSKNYQISRYAGYKSFNLFNIQLNKSLIQAQLYRAKSNKLIDPIFNIAKKVL